MGLQIRWQHNIVFLLLLCAASLVEAKAQVLTLTDQNNTSESAEKLECKRIIGNVEKVRLAPLNVVQTARIDTGAKTTSIDARNIMPFKRGGKQWVRFVIVEGEKEHTLERKVVKTVQIKRHGAESQDRYVVKMRIILGDVSRVVSVTLNDRDAYTYPVLIGRNFLHDYCIVDVDKKFQFKPIKLPKSN